VTDASRAVERHRVELMAKIEPPEPPLADGQIVLRPLGNRYIPEFDRLLEVADVRANTRVPSNPPPDFGTTWAALYEAGWAEGDRFGFAIHDRNGDEFLGFAGFVDLHLDQAEGELGYVLLPEGRGRGAATRALRLLTPWGFEVLRLQRIELVIADGNVASERVAERTGFKKEGVLRAKYFKEELRGDTSIWSRLPTDPG
jgi:RimJ/RimL family protein N-acetyltransferase